MEAVVSDARTILAAGSSYSLYSLNVKLIIGF